MKRRIAHDEIRLRPLGASGILVVFQNNLCALVGDFLAGDGMRLRGVSVPDREHFAGLGIATRDLFVVGEDSILLTDGAIFRQERAVAGVGLAGGLALPLEIPDPEHELGDGDGVMTEFEPEKLFRTNFVFRHLEGRVSAEGCDQLEHFGLKPLHMLEGDVEEVRGAAGRIEHGESAQVPVVVGDELERLGVFLFRVGPQLHGSGSGLFRGGRFAGGQEHFACLVLLIGFVVGEIGLAVETGGGDADGIPLLAQRINDGRPHESLHIRARRVMGPELVPLARIEGAGQ
jgi:hypothetical protein